MPKNKAVKLVSADDDDVYDESNLFWEYHINVIDVANIIDGPQYHILNTLIIPSSMW